MTTWGTGSGASCVPIALKVTSTLSALCAGKGSSTVSHAVAANRPAMANPSRTARTVLVTGLLEGEMLGDGVAPSGLVVRRQTRDSEAAILGARERRGVVIDEPRDVDEQIEMRLSRTHRERQAVALVETVRKGHDHGAAGDGRDAIDAVRRGLAGSRVREARCPILESRDPVGPGLESV